MAAASALARLAPWAARLRPLTRAPAASTAGRGLALGVGAAGVGAGAAWGLGRVGAAVGDTAGNIGEGLGAGLADFGTGLGAGLRETGKGFLLPAAIAGVLLVAWSLSRRT